MLEKTEAAYLAGIIDGEGTISLTRAHLKENRRPVISIPSNDRELLDYIKNLVGGYITSKKNYKPGTHKDSYVLSVKNKSMVMSILRDIIPYLKIKQKKLRAQFILDHYENVTCRNGKYTDEKLILKRKFEQDFFSL
ncbi:hypothetical protein BTR22_19930 [Alkalihalophilus pseudofirmus]|nr:hypothetical protein BTR22_19930 [Alkalihalophilus pseudofirmus]